MATTGSAYQSTPVVYLPADELGRVLTAAEVAYEYLHWLGEEGIADYSPAEPLAEAIAILRRRRAAA